MLNKPAPGQPLRLAFDWRAMDPVQDSPAMFAHLSYQGMPIAQRDAVPDNGLFPVDTWTRGEVVRDPFTLPLPPELAPGIYELQVGIYDPLTQMRYSLLEPADGTFVVVERLIIE